jgi:hypothetical protein
MQSALSNTKGVEQTGVAIDTVKNNLKSFESLIPQSIQKVTGLDSAFRKVKINLASGDLKEAEESLKGVREALNKATINGKDFGTVLQSLHGKSIAELK